MAKTVQQVKRAYQRGDLDDDEFEQQIEAAVEAQEAARGDVEECAHCGEPLMGFSVLETGGKYHLDCLEDKRQEEYADVGLVIGISVSIIVGMLLVFAIALFI